MKKAVIGLSVLVVALAALLLVSVFQNEEVTVSAADLDMNQVKIDSYASGRILTPANARALMAENPNVIVVDIRKAADYALGHIPGAINIFRGDYSADESVYGVKGMRTDRAGLEALMGRLGATEETILLAYDAKGDYDAARFWWQLDMQGFTNVKVIDGGINTWKAMGYEISTVAPDVAPTDFEFTVPENTARLATLEDVLAAQDDPNVVILDTRAITEFTGEETKSGAARPGRIPGAVWLEYKVSIDPETTCFDCIEDLRVQFAELGITRDKTIIPYCQSGVRSAHTTFVLTQLLGYPDVRNYDGSWLEWSHTEELPALEGMPADVADRVAVAN